MAGGMSAVVGRLFSIPETGDSVLDMFSSNSETTT
jgi:hypothetical protein